MSRFPECAIFGCGLSEFLEIDPFSVFLETMQLRAPLQYCRSRTRRPTSMPTSRIPGPRYYMYSGILLDLYIVQGFGRCALPRAAPTSGAERATGLWLRRA